MLEKIMKKHVKNKLNIFKVKFTDIETGSVSIGVPDWHLRTDKKDIWIEAKKIKRWPVHDNTTIKIPYRPGQYNWLKSYQDLGGTSLLMVTYKNEWYLFKDIRKEYTKFEMRTLTLLNNTDFESLDKYCFINLLNNDI